MEGDTKKQDNITQTTEILQRFTKRVDMKGLGRPNWTNTQKEGAEIVKGCSREQDPVCSKPRGSAGVLPETRMTVYPFRRQSFSSSLTPRRKMNFLPLQGLGKQASTGRSCVTLRNWSSGVRIFYRHLNQIPGSVSWLVFYLSESANNIFPF